MAYRIMVGDSKRRIFWFVHRNVPIISNWAQAKEIIFIVFESLSAYLVGAFCSSTSRDRQSRGVYGHPRTEPRDNLVYRYRTGIKPVFGIGGARRDGLGLVPHPLSRPFSQYFSSRPWYLSTTHTACSLQLENFK